MSIATSMIRKISGLFYLGLTLAAIAVLSLIVIFFISVKDLPQVPDPLSRIIETPATEIYAGDGKRILVLGGREYIPLSRISRHFIKAVIATEDHRFWKHHGIDKIRTVKALWITLFHPGKIQGASTITQQLAKNLFFSFEQTYKRKFQEMLVAFQIESRYSKQEILEAYLNQIPFGVGAQGIEQASRKFFGKPASDLTIEESALLAGIPKSPARYNPFNHFERSKRRQKTVLRRMVAVSAITEEMAHKAGQEPLNLAAKPAGARTGSYFLDAVVKELEQRYGPDVVYHGGLRVSTTVDPLLQIQAASSMKNGLAKLDKTMGEPKGPRPQGAIVAVDANSGAVKALVGGRDYFTSEYNRALANTRQPGSGFKPFLYYAGFEKMGYSPATVFEDRAVVIPVKGSKPWRVNNFEKRYTGPMTLKRALRKSVNTIAAQLVQDVTPETVIDVARRSGITSPLKPYLSVALGSIGVSPLEMASSYATLAAGGVRHKPFLIKRVEDYQGRILDDHIVSGEKTLDKSTVYQVVDMMRAVVDSGTGAVSRRMGFTLPAAGKTGTTNDYNDAWFTGFTPNLSVSVWVGYDTRKRLRDKRGVGITGGRGAAPIWADFMLKATSGQPERNFYIPPDIHFETVDGFTGCRPDSTSTETLKVALKKGQIACPQQQGLTQNINPKDN